MLKNFFLRMFKNPFGLYLLWMIFLMTFCIIGIPLLSIGHSGGEQVPFTLLGNASNALVFGFILISLVSPIAYWNWYKKYAFIPLIVPVLIIALLSLLIIHIYISNGHHFAW
jgi:hypothetical protein